MDSYKAKIGDNQIMCANCGSDEFYVEKKFYGDIYDISSPYKRLREFYLEAQCSNCGNEPSLTEVEWNNIEFYTYSDEVDKDRMEDKKIDKNKLRYMEVEGSEIYIKLKGGEEIHLSCLKEDLQKNYDKGGFVLKFECSFLTECSIKSLLLAVSDEINTLIMRKGFIEAETNEMNFFEFSFVGGRLRYDKIKDGERYYYKFEYLVGIEESKADFRRVEDK